MTIFMQWAIRRADLYQSPALSLGVRSSGTSHIGWAEF